MQENKHQLIHYAMSAGIFLGMFWVAKYLLVIGGTHFSALGAINTIASIGTPLLLYFFLIKYKTNVLQGQNLGYGDGIQLSVALFFFASLFEAVAVFIHVKWIDPQFIAALYENMREVAAALKFSPQIVTALSEQPQPAPFAYVLSNVIMNNLFAGLLLSLALVPLANQYKPKQISQ